MWALLLVAGCESEAPTPPVGSCSEMRAPRDLAFAYPSGGTPNLVGCTATGEVSWEEGEALSVNVSRYNALGQLASYASRRVDSSSWTVDTYTYDARDRLVSLQRDEGEDGAVDYVLSFPYDGPDCQPEGRVWDFDNDGEVDLEERFTWDGGRIVEARGSDDNPYRVAWEYDGPSPHPSWRGIRSGDEPWHNETTYVYDLRWRLVQELEAPGVEYFVTTYTYDADDHVVYEETIDPAGNLYSTVTRTWEDGRVVHVRNTQPQFEPWGTSYAWECPG